MTDSFILQITYYSAVITCGTEQVGTFPKLISRPVMVLCSPPWLKYILNLGCREFCSCLILNVQP